MIIFSCRIERKNLKFLLKFFLNKQKYNFKILRTFSDWSEWFLRRPPIWRIFLVNLNGSNKCEPIEIFWVAIEYHTPSFFTHTFCFAVSVVRNSDQKLANRKNLFLFSLTLPGVATFMKLWMYTFTKVAIKNWQSNLKKWDYKKESRYLTQGVIFSVLQFRKN